MTFRFRPVVLAVAFAAWCASASAGQPTPASVAGQLASIPTSPAFSMNIHHNDGGVPEDKAKTEGAKGHEAAPESHETAHDAHEKDAKAEKPGKPEKVEKAEKTGKAENGDKAEKSAKAEASPGKAKAAEAEGDPLEHLRQRLAEKLGAKTSANTGVGARYVMRVSSRDEPGESVISARSGAVAGGRRAAARAAGASAPGAAASLLPTQWDYAGLGGPQSWARIKPEFAQCSNGTRQSPIDIRGGIAVDLEPIQFDYRPSAFSVVDNGHTVQVNLEPGNAITITGRRYELVQFHFHRPSEERIDGRQFDMVVHLVHKDADGKEAVVAVLLDRGSAQPLVQTVWNNLPLEKNDEVHAEAKLDLTQLLPKDRRYYTYMGSMTTPPCTEGVLWMVMKQPVSISPEQVAIFAHLYPMNARPVQQADGRLIKQSN